MQYKVPQNIDKEDQIIGPLTLIEFSYLAIGGALDVLINQTINSSFKYVPMFFITVIALAFTFLKINDRSMLDFLMAAISYVSKPKMRVWRKESDRPILTLESKPVEKKAELPGKDVNQSKIDTLAHVLDTGGESNSPAQPPKMPFKNIDQKNLE